jgi:hypothetical protein
MQTYQSQLLLSRSFKIVGPRPGPRPQPPQPKPDFVALRASLDACSAGHWFCSWCEGPCERSEGDQGQPHHCSRCGSCRITWRNAPAKEAA